MYKETGYTIVEIIIVLTVLSILLAISWSVSTSYMVRARDTDRQSDIDTIARSFEWYYRSQSSTSGIPTYPGIAQLSAAPSFVRSSENSLYAPFSSSVSLKPATNTSDQTPAVNEYIYQPYDADGNLCTDDTASCVRFTLYWHSEKDDGTKIMESMRQQ